MSFNPKNPATLDLLLNRRSEKSKRMTGPGPNEGELADILQSGMRVPDHGKLAPWRFLVFQGPAQKKLSAEMARCFVKEGGEQDSSRHIAQMNFAHQAPVLIVVVSRLTRDHKIPTREQLLSAGAACQNLLVASHALGYVGQWLTGTGAYSKGVAKYLGLGENEAIAGFIFIGNSNSALKERPRPEFDDIVTYWPND
jgi:nitroreductase